MSSGCTRRELGSLFFFFFVVFSWGRLQREMRGGGGGGRSKILFMSTLRITRNLIPHVVFIKLVREGHCMATLKKYLKILLIILSDSFYRKYPDSGNLWLDCRG